MLIRMATTSPPQPPSEDVERIVGDRLEAELTEAGLDPPVARAIDHALRFLVLQLLIVLASKAEVRQIVSDSAEGLRREFLARFDAIDQRFADIDKRFADIYQLLRWNLFLTGALLTALIGLAIYDRIAG